MLAMRFLEISAAGDAGTRIPVSVIKGARPGPVLALIAGNGRGHQRQEATGSG